MQRRQILELGALSAAPLFGHLFGHTAFAQQVMAPGAADIGLDPAKQPMIAGGTFTKMASELALERGSAELVQTFAQLEIAEVEAVVEAFGAQDAPPIMTQEQADLLETLRGAEGDGFDAAYVEAQIDAHTRLRDIASEYARTGGDPMARGAAMVAVPSIESHLAMLDLIRGTLDQTWRATGAGLRGRGPALLRTPP